MDLLTGLIAKICLITLCLDAAIRVVKYIKNEPGLGILLDFDSKLDLFVYCDLDWAMHIESRKYVTRYCIKLGKSLICWQVKKQSTVSRSLVEAKYRSIGITLSKIVWLRRLLEEVGIGRVSHVVLLCYNKVAFQITYNHIFYERNKHAEINFHYIREK